MAVRGPAAFFEKNIHNGILARVYIPRRDTDRGVSRYAGKCTGIASCLSQAGEEGVAQRIKDEGTNSVDGSTCPLCVAAAHTQPSVGPLHAFQRRSKTIERVESSELPSAFCQRSCIDKERYRWRLRSSFQTGNPFGIELAALANGVGSLVTGPYAFTGAIATTIDAPFIDIDVIHTFVLGGLGSGTELRELKSQASIGPPIRVITPYDAGVLMHERNGGKAPIVSAVQAYLKLSKAGEASLRG